GVGHGGYLGKEGRRDRTSDVQVDYPMSGPLLPEQSALRDTFLSCFLLLLLPRPPCPLLAYQAFSRASRPAMSRHLLRRGLRRWAGRPAVRLSSYCRICPPEVLVDDRSGQLSDEPGPRSSRGPRPGRWSCPCPG